MRSWQTLVQGVQDEGVDAVELNYNHCPHMDRDDMGSGLGKDAALVSTTTQAVKEVARIPVWAKLTPATADIAEEAGATFRGGADAITSSNTFPSLPPIDPETLDFEINVDGFVSPGGLGGPAILMQSLAKMAQMTQAYPDGAFSGVGGISDLGRCPLLLHARLRHGAGGDRGHAGQGHRAQRGALGSSRAWTPSSTQHADRGWTTLDDFRGLRRDADRGPVTDRPSRASGATTPKTRARATRARRRHIRDERRRPAPPAYHPWGWRRPVRRRRRSAEDGSAVLDAWPSSGPPHDPGPGSHRAPGLLPCGSPERTIGVGPS